MKKTQISYSYARTIPTRQYGSDRIEARTDAILDEGEDAAAALAQLRADLKAQIDADELLIAAPHAAIVFVYRDETKNSKSPLWRCATADGRAVNIFQHADPSKDNFRYFKEAGYGEFLLALELGDSQRWTDHPIGVTLDFDGRFWNCIAVKPRISNAVPDGEDDSLDRLRAANDELGSEE